MTYLLIAIVSLGGLYIAHHIYQKKKKEEHIACPIGADCNQVVHSIYSQFLGIPLEKMGMAYYIGTALIYFVLYLFPGIRTPEILFLVSGAALGGALFSTYLIYIQGVTLKEWCTWCLGSAAVSFAIFVMSFFGSLEPVTQVLAQQRSFILTLHIAGMALGFGGAVFSDVMFFRFLKDKKISEKESEVLHIFSQVIWVAVGLIVLTGIGIYLPEIATYNESAKFLSKVSVVGVIIFNGLLLNYFISPKLTDMHFEHTEHEEPLWVRLRQIAFALGAVSLTSWVTAFMLAMSDITIYSYGQLMGTYGLILIIAIFVSQLLERRITRS